MRSTVRVRRRKSQEQDWWRDGDQVMDDCMIGVVKVVQLMDAGVDERAVGGCHGRSDRQVSQDR